MSLNKGSMLVIGGAGFIGSHLCDALLAEGKRVICVDNLMRGTKDHIRQAMENEKFSFAFGDASCVDFLDILMRENSIDTVFHLAANSDIQASAQEPQIEFDSTLSTTWAVLSSMKRNKVNRLFFASSSAVYGEQTDAVLRENDPLAPVSYYGAAKAASEALIQAFCHMNDMSACVFRFANVIGPRLTHGVVYDFVHKLRADPKCLRVLGNGTQTKPYIDVGDLVRAILMLYQQVSGVEIYNVGVGSTTSVSAIAEMVRREMGLPDAEIRYGSESIGWKGDVPRFQFDLAKIHDKGWQAKLSSDEAVLLAVREAIACTL